jgi:hypothetical protein
MKRRKFFILIGIGVLVIMIGVATFIFAQEQQKPAQQQSSMVIMLGGLKLKEGADTNSAEKLFNEYLIPSMKDKKGLKMKVLKKMPLPNEKPNPNSYDYVMMAEIDDPMMMMQLMSSQGRDGKLEQFGKAMKEYAVSEPNIAVYTIFANTDEPTAIDTLPRVNSRDSAINDNSH